MTQIFTGSSKIPQQNIAIAFKTAFYSYNDIQQEWRGMVWSFSNFAAFQVFWILPRETNYHMILVGKGPCNQSSQTLRITYDFQTIQKHKAIIIIKLPFKASDS